MCLFKKSTILSLLYDMTVKSVLKKKNYPETVKRFISWVRVRDSWNVDQILPALRNNWTKSVKFIITGPNDVGNVAIDLDNYPISIYIATDKLI